jgi:hypothetical protein
VVRTRTRTGAVAADGEASRKEVVTCGRTLTFALPLTERTFVQTDSPARFRWSIAEPALRVRAASVTLWPFWIVVAPVRRRTPIVNQLERSPSLERKVAPVKSTGPGLTCTSATRLDELREVLRSLRAPSPRARRIAGPRQTQSRPAFAQSSSASVGPQRWCGEIESKGSGTLFRYGNKVWGEPHSSETEAVLPPEVEKKNVEATPEPEVSTSPAVPATASFVDDVSASTPP